MQFNIARGEPQNAAARWKRQYFRNGAWGSTIDGSAQTRYDALIALGATPSREAVEAIAPGWGSVWCSCCKGYVAIAASIDAGDGSGEICLPCIEVMAVALRQAS